MTAPHLPTKKQNYGGTVLKEQQSFIERLGGLKLAEHFKSPEVTTIVLFCYPINYFFLSWPHFVEFTINWYTVILIIIFKLYTQNFFNFKSPLNFFLYCIK